jgi:alpha-amylase/alpha-mannosidase (GH57 family)
MQKFVCIHGHFYQPPRENPWTKKVEEEGSAHPFHDWNERITSECYAPNAGSPLFNEGGLLSKLVNNYSWISFDFGPTLLNWLESNSSELYESIIEADRLSIKRFRGHGSAMAQVYNHMIMPLANSGDKRTQTLWGAEDFERRFGRYPEGMWIPETAVDLDTLEALAENQIKFTILSPHQALAVRRNDGGEWVDVSGGRVDTTRAYACALPSGKTMNLFFFDKGLSTGISFGDLLANGDVLARTLVCGFSESDEPQLANVASDGETYGHHRKNGHIALTRCLSQIERSNTASILNYGLFLSLAPPTHEVKIAERTSWSCAHGVERWRSNCGCGSEIRPGYNQDWRSPLRSSLDWLGGQFTGIYLEEGLRVLTDSTLAKDHLHSVAFHQEAETRRYLQQHLKSRLSEREKSNGAKLLELLDCSALMYASCAWFWEDISRTESVQALRFAARGIELVRDLVGIDLEPEFEHLLLAAKPNDPRFNSGAQLYELLARAGNRN